MRNLMRTASLFMLTAAVIAAVGCGARHDNAPTAASTAAPAPNSQPSLQDTSSPAAQRYQPLIQQHSGKNPYAR